MAASLPQEIWWMICQELTAQHDFNSLFSFALVSHSAAELALPLLYSIHEHASASADDASSTGKAKLAALWRAIILSTVEKTIYPYCLWITSLKLGNLRELLSDLAPYPALRDAFFADEMAQFHLVDHVSKPTRQNRPRLNIQAISTKVGDTLTAFVQGAAERENKSVALAHLEDRHISVDVLPRWVSRLSTLVSLSIQDGSVMGAQVASAIRDHCPRFRELELYECLGPSVDDDLAAFFAALPSNSLSAFSIINRNRLGKASLDALATGHSSSLRKLNLSALTAPAFERLGALSSCTRLTSLALEASQPASFDWEGNFKHSFLQLAALLRDLSTLTRLQLVNVPGATTLLGRVLKSPNLRLTDLNLELCEDDGDKDFYSSLAHQADLAAFSLRSRGDPLDPATMQHAQLVRSLCRLRALKKLDLMQTPLTEENIRDLGETLLLLEEFSFDGDDFQDDVLATLARFPRLRTAIINATSCFTFDALLDFIDSLQRGDDHHRGFGLYIMNQLGTKKFSQDEEDVLAQNMLAAVGGTLEILIYRDPDEEHESDFSD